MKSKSRIVSSTSYMSGFTLVELLVTIVIIVILAALGFVGSNRMIAAANKSISLNNLKNLQAANGIYASRYNGRFLGTYERDSEGGVKYLWDRNDEFLDIYLGEERYASHKNSEVRVSSKYLDPVAYKARANGYDTLKANYGMISRIGWTNSPPNTNSSYRIGELTAPSQTAAFVTAVNWLVQYSGRFRWEGVEGKVNAPMMAYRHNNKALVAYYDGSVGEVTKEDMEEFDRRGGKNNSFWKGDDGRP